MNNCSSTSKSVFSFIWHALMSLPQVENNPGMWERIRRECCRPWTTTWGVAEESQRIPQRTGCPLSKLLMYWYFFTDRIHIGSHPRGTSGYSHSAHETTRNDQTKGATTSPEASKNQGVPRITASKSWAFIFTLDWTDYWTQNIDLARDELRVARDEHTKLIQLRERLLDRMAESVV